MSHKINKTQESRFDFCRSMHANLRTERTVQNDKECKGLLVEIVTKHNFNSILDDLSSRFKNESLTVFIGTIDIHKAIGQFENNEYLKVKALDSNNWFRYINLFEEVEVGNESTYRYFKQTENENLMIDFAALNNELDSFERYAEEITKLDYFNLVCANESALFHSERVQKATIKDVGGHAGKILKYSFHSEQKALENALKSYQQLEQVFKWFNSDVDLSYRLLILDDYSERVLNHRKDEYSNEPGTRNKTEMLLEMMKLTFRNMGMSAEIEAPHDNVGTQLIVTKESNNNRHILRFEIRQKSAVGDVLLDDRSNTDPSKPSEHGLVFNGKSSIKRDRKYHQEETRNTISRNQEEQIMDLYLLDFLFMDFQDDQEDVFKLGLRKNERHYGVSFLNEIKNHPKNIVYPKAPLNLYWILPISTFSHSMLGEMRNQDIDLISKNYYLNNGADPINTPFYFVASLLSIINRQIEKSMPHDTMEPERIFESIRASFHLNLFKDSEVEKENEYWLNKFNKITSITVWLDSLKRDSKNSPFAKSMNDMVKDHKFVRVLEHYREYVYQKAFHSSENNEILIIERQKILHLLNS